MSTDADAPNNTIGLWDRRAAESGLRAVFTGRWSDEQAIDVDVAQSAVLLSLAGPLDRRTVLDLGCGNGRLTARLAARRAVAVHATDISPGMVERTARDVPAAHCLVMQPGILPYANDQFDVIFASFVFQHILDDALFARTVAECCRVLAPGGILVEMDGLAARPFRPNNSSFTTVRTLAQMSAAFGPDMVLDSLTDHLLIEDAYKALRWRKTDRVDTKLQEALAAPASERIAPVHVEFDRADVEIAGIALRDLLERGYVSQGEHVEEFEAEFKAYVGSRHAVAVSSGSMAIEAGTAACLGRSGSGREARRTVLVPANTNFATWVSVKRGGGVPRLVDIDIATLSPSLTLIEAAAAPDVAGVILVHMGGIITPEIDAIVDWCSETGRFLLEDCAHAHGSARGGQHAGRFGAAGLFSFFATKVITSGEGGMLVTDDDEVAAYARKFRNLGKSEPWQNIHHIEGTNGRMTEFSAIVGRRQLAHLDSFLAHRRALAYRYSERLGASALIPVLPDHPASWYKFVVLPPLGHPRDRYVDALRAGNASPSGFIYECPLHRQPALADAVPDVHAPVSEDYCYRHFCLPLHTAMSLADVDRICDVLDGVA